MIDGKGAIFGRSEWKGMNAMRAGRSEKTVVVEERRGYRPRESESKYFESVNAGQKRTKTAGAEDTRQSFRNGGKEEK